MSDSKEKSDDLIAELAKLMASNAQGSEADPKQTVIKLPPLGEASVPSPGPVRIPGMDAQRPAGGSGAAPASAAPTVRIPGMEKPAGISDPPPPAEPPPRPASQLDFGRPPSAMPALKSEPLTNWQAHQSSGVPAVPQPPSASKASAPEARQQPSEPLSAHPLTSAPAAGMERPAPAPDGQNAHPPQSDGSGFNFDFGFGASGDDAGSAPAAQPTDDPIADLIAAELDAADAAPEPRPEAPRSQPAESTALQSATAARPLQSMAPRQAAVATPLKPVSVTPRAAESDRFATAPVFGGNGNGSAEPPTRTPAPAGQPATALTTRQREELDPIEEIESLIGEAVRVELAGPEKPAQRAQAAQPAPVVPPLSTGFAPRRAGLADSTNHAQSAEDAILAAAAASGANVERIDADEAEDRPYKRMKVKPPRTSFVPSGARQYVGIAVAGTLLLAAGFGLYWVLGMGGGDPATAPVLTADAAPAKVEPAVTPVTAAEPSGSVIFDEIAGGSAGDVETLVSRDETAGASVAEVARTVTPVVEEAAETGLANRKVRTVTVRPDGTIVSADDAIAGTEALPVERPNVPEIEGEGIEPSELLTAAVSETDPGGVATAAEGAVDPIAALVAETGEATTTPLDEPAPLDVAALDTGDTVQPVFDGSLTPPIPMPRPSDRGSLVGGGSVAATATPAGVLVNEPASTPLVAVTQGETAAAAPAATRSGAYAQIASLPTESDAQSQVRAQTGRFGSLFNGASLEVRRVDLGAKGVWYRVVLPVSSFQEATQVCATIEANGGDCIPNGG